MAIVVSPEDLLRAVLFGQHLAQGCDERVREKDRAPAGFALRSFPDLVLADVEERVPYLDASVAEVEIRTAQSGERNTANVRQPMTDTRSIWLARSPLLRMTLILIW